MIEDSRIAPVPWRATVLWPDNPRRRIDEASLRELSESIRRQGVLQNLVGRPLAVDDTRYLDGFEYEVVCGQRRWRAVERLVKDGALPEDFAIPLRVAEIDDREALLLAIVENVQRSDMDPWEEAEAFGRLIEVGESVYSIAERVGVSPRLVKSRRALLGLVPEAMAALQERRINLGQAGAFTVGAAERQRELLPVVLDQPDYAPSRIRERMVGQAVPLDWALFDPALYRGPVRPDLFEERSYAEDRALFRALQEQAVMQKVGELSRRWSWAEPQIGGYFAPWDFDRDGEPSVAGAVVHLRADLRVEIHTGLIRRPSPAPADPEEPPRGGVSKGRAPYVTPPPAVRRSEGPTTSTPRPFRVAPAAPTAAGPEPVAEPPDIAEQIAAVRKAIGRLAPDLVRYSGAELRRVEFEIAALRAAVATLEQVEAGEHCR